MNYKNFLYLLAMGVLVYVLFLAGTSNKIDQNLSDQTQDIKAINPTEPKVNPATKNQTQTNTESQQSPPTQDKTPSIETKKVDDTIYFQGKDSPTDFNSKAKI
jgi:hypothetical protein